MLFSRRPGRIVAALAASLALTISALAGCESSSSKSKKPAGTPTDPVEVCERLADVCRYQSSQLGVCIQSSDTGSQKLVCAPQH